MRPKPGDRIAERYEVREFLGAGSFGEVLRVLDVRLDREVALKLMSEVAGGVAPRVWREARAAADLRHPHLVPILDMGLAAGERPFLVFELIPGGDLSSRLEEAGPASPEEVERWTRGLGEALAALHEREAMHRDVKPANVLLHSDGRALLADLGLARVAGQETLTATGQVLGTLAYMAPEVLAGQLPTPEADLYALGCTAWEALTGETWFRIQERWENADISGELARLPWLADLLAPEPAVRREGWERLRRGDSAVGQAGTAAGASQEPEGRSEASGAVARRSGSGPLPWILAAGVLVGALAMGGRHAFSPAPGPGDMEKVTPTRDPDLPGAGEVSLGLTELLERMPPPDESGERHEQMARLSDPALALRTRRLLDALQEITPAEAHAAPQEWIRAGHLYLLVMMRQVKGIGDWLADILLIPGDREILPLGEVQNFQAFHDDLQDQLRAFARKARASEHWGRAPLLDLVHTEVARFLGWKIEARLIQSLIRGAETAPVGLQLDAFMSQLVRVTTQAQGEEGLRIGDTALRQRVVEVLLQRTLRDLRGKRPSPEFQTACVWPLAHYLDAAFVARQAEVVAAALEGSPLSSPPPELEGRFRLLMAREAGAGVERLFLLHLERWFWNQDISLPAIPESGAARLVRERQLQLFEKLDGDVWGLRWKR